jgi:hypothetical protein
VALIAWTRNSGRFTDLGRVLGVTPKVVDLPGLRSRWLVPLRYALSLCLTAAWLARRRPRVVIVNCPPPFAAVIVAIYARLFGRTFILDAHPGAFGHRDRLWKLFVPLQRLLVRLAATTMVTEPSLAKVVDRWRGSPLVFHEAPPPLEPLLSREGPSRRPKVIFTTIFDPDEPLEEIARTACLLEECDVAITGDRWRLPHDIRRRLAALPHVELTGWLGQVRYLELVGDADVVVALTRDPHSVMRSAFEAAYLERPTVLSDTATLRACFSPSVFVEHSPQAIAEGVRTIIADYASWRQPMRVRHQTLMRRWASQRTELESAIEQAGRAAGADRRIPSLQTP